MRLKLAVWPTRIREAGDPEEKPSNMPSGWLAEARSKTKQGKKNFLALYRNNCISNVSAAKSPEGPITKSLRLLTRK